MEKNDSILKDLTSVRHELSRANSDNDEFKHQIESGELHNAYNYLEGGAVQLVRRRLD